MPTQAGARCCGFGIRHAEAARLCHAAPVQTVTIVTRSFAKLQVSARCCRASVCTAGTFRLRHPGATRGPGPQARRQARHSLLVTLSILVCPDFFWWVFRVRNVRHPGAKTRLQARRSSLPTAVPQQPLPCIRPADCFVQQGLLILTGGLRVQLQFVSPALCESELERAPPWSASQACSAGFRV